MVVGGRSERPLHIRGQTCMVGGGGLAPTHYDKKQVKNSVIVHCVDWGFPLSPGVNPGTGGARDVLGCPHIYK